MGIAYTCESCRNNLNRKNAITICRQEEVEFVFCSECWPSFERVITDKIERIENFNNSK
jgi:hypothetical protein